MTFVVSVFNLKKKNTARNLEKFSKPDISPGEKFASFKIRIDRFGAILLTEKVFPEKITHHCKTK